MLSVVLGFSKINYVILNFVSIIIEKKIRKEELQKFKDNSLSGYRNCPPQFQEYYEKAYGSQGKKEKMKCLLLAELVNNCQQT